MLPTKPLQVANSSRLVWVDVDQSTGLRFNPACGKAIRTPFIKGTQPQQMSYCEPPVSADPVAPEPATAAPLPPAAAPVVVAAPAKKKADSSGRIDDLMQ